MASSFVVLAMWSHMAMEATAFNSALGGDYVYFSERLFESFSFSVVDISDPTNPWVVASFLDNQDQLGGLDMAIQGNYAYLVGDRLNSTGISIHGKQCDLFLLRVVSISDPTKPVIAHSMQVPNGTLANNWCSTGSGITIVDDYAYVVGSFGLAVVNISDPMDPVIAWLGSLKPGYNHHNGIAIVGDYAYISGLGRGNTTHTETGTWWPAPPTWWSRNYTELTMGYGLTVVNISDPSTPRLTGWMHEEDYDVDDLLLDFGALEFNSLTANIAIVGDYAYIAFYNGVRFVDVSDRSRPRLFSDHLGHPSGGMYFGVWTPSWNKGMAVVGNYACFAFYSWTCFTNVSNYHSRRPPKIASDVDAWAMGPAAVSGEYVYIANPPGVAVYNISAPTKWSLVGSTPTTTRTRTSSTITTTASAFHANAAQVVAPSALAVVLGVAHLQQWLA